MNIEIINTEMNLETINTEMKVRFLLYLILSNLFNFCLLVLPKPNE